MTFDVEITYDTRLASAWITICELLGRVVGTRRATDWAASGALRLIRWRVGRGAWRRGVL